MTTLSDDEKMREMVAKAAAVAFRNLDELHAELKDKQMRRATEAVASCDASLPAYRAITKSVAEFPYSHMDLFTRDMFEACWVIGYPSESNNDYLKTERARINKSTRYGLSRTVKLFTEGIREDFAIVISSIASGAIARESGAWPSDIYGYPDISAYVTELTDLDTSSPCPWHRVFDEETARSINVPGTRPYVAPDGTKYAISPWANLSPWGKLTVLSLMCQDGYEAQIRAILTGAQSGTVVKTAGTSQTQIVPVSKVAKYVRDGKLPMTQPDGPKQWKQVDITGPHDRTRGKKYRDLVTVALVDDKSNTIRSTRRLDAFDWAIQSGLAAKWCTSGNADIFTLRQLTTAVFGGDQPTREQEESVKQYIDMQRYTRATIDFTDEVRKAGYEPEGKRLQVTNPLCSIREEPVVLSNGRAGVGYRLLAPPLLYEHTIAVSERTGKPPQITSFPSAWLGYGPRNSKTNLIIKRTLATFVMELRNNHNGQANNTRRYIHDDKHPGRPGLLEIAGVNLSDARASKKAKDCALAWLEEMKANGEIKGYKEDKEGRIRAKVSIVVK